MTLSIPRKTVLLECGVRGNDLVPNKKTVLLECGVRGNDPEFRVWPLSTGGLMTLSSDFDPLLQVGSVTTDDLPSHYSNQTLQFNG